MAEQPRLFDFRQEDRSAASLLISESNATAWSRLAQWRNWPGRVLALVGPEGSGKTHMAQAWLSRLREEGESGALVVDDADVAPDEEALAFLLDRVRAGEGPALLVGRALPSHWPARLPDLRSRFASLPVAMVEEPDEALLAGILQRFCKARFIKLTESASAFLAERMERSFRAAHAFVELIDKEHVVGSRPVSVRAAARALRLFEEQRSRAAEAPAKSLAEDA